MWLCLCYSKYINVVKADKVIEFVKFAPEGTCVEHGNTKIAFLRDGGGVGGWDFDNEWVAKTGRGVKSGPP